MPAICLPGVSEVVDAYLRHAPFVGYSVLLIFLTSDPPEIFKSVVTSVPIEVVNLWFAFRVFQEGLGNQTVNQIVLVPYHDSHISTSALRAAGPLGLMIGVTWLHDVTIGRYQYSKFRMLFYS